MLSLIKHCAIKQFPVIICDGRNRHTVEEALSVICMRGCPAAAAALLDDERLKAESGGGSVAFLAVKSWMISIVLALNV